MHWTFLQVLITTSTTTTIIIIKLSKCGVWHPTRGLLRFCLPGNSIIEIVQKATGIQKSGDETFRYLRAFSFRQPLMLCRAKIPCLLWWYKCNTFRGVTQSWANWTAAGINRGCSGGSTVDPLKPGYSRNASKTASSEKIFLPIPPCSLKLKWSFYGIFPCSTIMESTYWKHLTL